MDGAAGKIRDHRLGAAGISDEAPRLRNRIEHADGLKYPHNRLREIHEVSLRNGHVQRQRLVDHTETQG